MISNLELTAVLRTVWPLHGYTLLKERDVCSTADHKMETTLSLLLIGIGGLAAGLAYVVAGPKIKHWLHRPPKPQ